VQRAESAVTDLLDKLAVSPELREATLSALQWQPPWSQLAEVDGWVLWLGHPPIPDEIDLVPAPGHLVWDDPVSALGVAVAVSLDYSARRGGSLRALRDFLAREAPLVVLVPGELHPAVRDHLGEVEGLGIPVLNVPPSPIDEVAELGPFAARREAHAVDLGRPHDPVFSFETVAVVGWTGNNSLSSLVLHPEGERDGVSITGEMSDRVGIEIGIRSTNFGVPESLALEHEAAQFPSFFEGVTSRSNGLALEIGWASGSKPTPDQLGGVFHVWLKALYRFEIVDVRIVFAPEHGRSARLVDMRERARHYSQYRNSLIADSDSGTVSDAPDDGPEC
jgi:hypothetical protein